MLYCVPSSSVGLADHFGLAEQLGPKHSQIRFCLWLRACKDDKVMMTKASPATRTSCMQHAVKALCFVDMYMVDAATWQSQDSIKSVFSVLPAGMAMEPDSAADISAGATPMTIEVGFTIRLSCDILTWECCCLEGFMYSCRGSW